MPKGLENVEEQRGSIRDFRNETEDTTVDVELTHRLQSFNLADRPAMGQLGR